MMGYEMTQFHVNKLENIDWKFAVATASSEINQIGQTFIQIKLTIGGKDTFFGLCMLFFEVLFFFLELSLTQFFAFLAEMEKIKSHLDSYTF
jgi:hypothetical protein